ncbi:ElyC/SanA/YdcF family protein [uncultured Planktosalinus sp.]|uniref:SanA/YdcF family protein n=1 Tax=uncultured Planktosalinus sp. TaxID=1810935 RepID=UPI0030DBCA59
MSYAISLAILALVAVLLVSDVIISAYSKDKTFDDSALIPKNKVGIVLGTSKYQKGGTINLYYQYRIDAVIELFHSGKIDFILISGDNKHQSYNEPQTIKNDLVKKGIPENKIYLDYAGFRTLDSMVRAKEIFGQESITVVSQQFHNERAVYIAEKRGVKAIGYNAKDVNLRTGFKVKLREYFARVKVFSDLLISKQPHFLGEQIEIK